MPELTSKERLQPSLLDRLTDDEPEKRQEAREARVLSMAQLRKSVLRDLAWLLNTGNLAVCEDIDAYPLVGRSVVNYGIPNFSGLTLAGLNKAGLEAALKQAIIDFEPRILRDSVRVRGTVAEGAMSRNAIGFVIEGDLAEQHKVPFTYDDAVVSLIASRCTELESGGRMVDAILTNTLLPMLSGEFLTRMMEGRPVERVHIAVSNAEFSYDFDREPELVA